MLELPLGLRFSHLGKNVHLVGHLFERRQYPSVALCKAVLVVFQTPFFGERHHKSIADFAEIVAGKTWEEVMRHLHVQTTVDKVEPARAVNVHGGADLAGSKAFVQSKIIARLGKMGKDNLNVQGRSDNVRDHEVREANRPVWKRAEQAVAIPRPEGDEPSELERPPSIATCFGGEETVRVGIEVKPAERHDDVIELVLMLEKEAARRVEFEDTPVIGRPEAQRF